MTTQFEDLTYSPKSFFAWAFDGTEQSVIDLNDRIQPYGFPCVSVRFAPGSPSSVYVDNGPFAELHGAPGPVGLSADFDPVLIFEVDFAGGRILYIRAYGGDIEDVGENFSGQYQIAP